MWIGPSRKPRDNVELSKKLGHDQMGIVCRGELVHLRNDAHERRFNAVDGLGREVLTVLLQAAMVFEKLFAIEVDER